MSEPIIKGGCFLVSRKLIDSGIMNKPPDYLKVWIYLLSNAFHTSKGDLERGQGFTSLPKLMEVLTYKVGYREERPTKKKVYGIIEWLRNPNEGVNEGSMIVTTKVTHGFVYTIVNYDLYQNISNYEGNNEGSTKVQRREEIGNNIKKNDKECKNDIKDMSDFEEIRKLFKGSKTVATAKKKLPDLIKKHSKEQMIRTVERYNQDVIKKRVKQPNLSYMNESTFWNGRYMDYLDENYQDEKQEPENMDWRTVTWISK